MVVRWDMTNWKEIQRDYETSKLTLAQLAEKHSIPLGTIKSQKSRDTKNGNPWMRGNDKVATKTSKVATSKKVATDKGSAVKQIPPEVQMVVDAFEEVTDENAELNESQRLFCLYFVKYHNATKAYQKAYESTYETANANGSRLMVKASVRAEISRLKKIRAAGIMLDGNDVLQEYIDIAFADLGDYVEYGTETVPLIDDEGFPVIDPTTGEPRVYQRSYVYLKNGMDLDNSIVSEVKIGKDGISLKLHSKMEALRFLAKYTDLLDDRTKTELQNERIKVELIRAELNKQQQEKEQELKLEQMNLGIEKSKADIELAKIAIAKEKGEEDEYEDDGFMEALKGVQVDWNKT